MSITSAEHSVCSMQEFISVLTQICGFMPQVHDFWETSNEQLNLLKPDIEIIWKFSNEVSFITNIFRLSVAKSQSCKPHISWTAYESVGKTPNFVLDCALIRKGEDKRGQQHAQISDIWSAISQLPCLLHPQIGQQWKLKALAISIYNLFAQAENLTGK